MWIGVIGNRGAWIVALTLFVCLSVLGIHYGPSPVEGDETEYYAMAYAWAANGSPTLTPAVVTAVRDAFPGRPPTEPIKVRAVDGSYDAIHFWFVSLLAAPFLALCRATGLDWKHCFVFPNSFWFAAAVGLAYRWFRWFGALVLALGLLVSSLVPYLNKAHADAYSVSLAAIVALCLVTGRWLAAAVALAAISIQVSAFAPLAALVLGKWSFDLWRTSRRPSAREWAGAGACVALIGLQPLWTLWRYHTLNVILAEGLVYPEMLTLKRFVSILIDPDVGFFFVWPLSVALLALIAAGARRRRLAGYWTFVAVLIATVACIEAQHTNYTTSAPRYSMWFVPFLLVGAIAVWHDRRKRVLALCCFLPAAAATGYYLYFVTGIHPRLERKPLAEMWYRYLPGVWDPEEQVFADLTMHDQLENGRDLFRKRRFPITRLVDRRTWALANRSCTKLLVFGWAFTSSHVEPLRPLGCEEPVDGRKLLAYVRRTGASGMEDRFVSVPLGRLGEMKAGPAEAVSLAPPPGHPPVVAGVDASDGVYTFRFSDPDGWQYLNIATMRIASCDVIYDQPKHELSMIRANGTISPAVAPGLAGELTSEFCSVDARRVSIEGSGDTLTVKLPVALRVPAAEVSAAVLDLDRRGSGAMGGIAFDAAGVSGPVTIGYPEGVSRIWILLHDKPSFERACYFLYEPATGALRLTPDDGDGANAPEMRLADRRSIENGRCVLDGRGSTASGTQLRLNVTRKGMFASTQLVWARYQKTDGTVSALQEIASWRGYEVRDAPLAASLGPDAREDLLHVRFQYGANQLADVGKVWLLVNDTLAVEHACYLLYEPAEGTVLLNGVGRRMPLGQGLLETPQCRVVGTGSSAVATSAELDLRLRVERKGSFRRPQRVWAADQKKDGKLSAWTAVGVWR